MPALNNPFVLAANAAKEQSCHSLARRIDTEGRIVRKLVETGLAMGLTASVNDGEDWVLIRSSKITEILAACFSTDEDRIRFRNDAGDNMGTFYLVYGNDGDDVISDYSVSETTDQIMVIVDDYIDTKFN